MYNLVGYSGDSSKTSRSSWQYYGDELNATLTVFASFKSKVKITENNPAVGNTKNVSTIAVSLKCLHKFYDTLAIPLMNCEIGRIMTCFLDHVISPATSTAITDI